MIDCIGRKSQLGYSKLFTIYAVKLNYSPQVNIYVSLQRSYRYLKEKYILCIKEKGITKIP